MDRPKRFYTEGLGWKVERDYGVSVFFGSDGGFCGLVLTYVVRSEARVDEIIAEAEKAGATILKPGMTQQGASKVTSELARLGYVRRRQDCSNCANTPTHWLN